MIRRHGSSWYSTRWERQTRQQVMIKQHGEWSDIYTQTSLGVSRRTHHISPCVFVRSWWSGRSSWKRSHQNSASNGNGIEIRSGSREGRNSMNKPCIVFAAAGDGLDWSALGSLCSKLASWACSLVVGGGGMAEGKTGYGRVRFAFCCIST